MSVFVQETTDDKRGDHLRIVRCGIEARLPFTDSRNGTVKALAQTPAWAKRIARQHEYTVVEGDVETGATATPGLSD